MLRKISCDLTNLPEDPDFLTWLSIYQSHVTRQSFDKLLKLYKIKRALVALDHELEAVLPFLTVEVINSPAYVGLFENIHEFISNAVDANVAKIDIAIPFEPTQGVVTIEYSDIGKGFSKTFLKNKEVLDYGEKVKVGQLNIDSDKDANQIGGAGTGLALSYHFVNHFGGTLTVANNENRGAKITLSSPPGTDVELRHQFHRMSRRITEKVDEAQSIKLTQALETKQTPEFVQHETSHERFNTPKLNLAETAKKKDKIGLFALTIPNESQQKFLLTSPSPKPVNEAHSPKLFVTPTKRTPELKIIKESKLTFQ